MGAKEKSVLALAASSKAENLSGVYGSEEESGPTSLVILKILDAAASQFNAAMQGASAQNQSLLRRVLKVDASLLQDEMSEIWSMMSARPGNMNEDERTDSERLREQCLLEFLSHVRSSGGQLRDTA